MRRVTRPLMIAGLLAVASATLAEPLRVALIPPQSFAPTLSQVRAAAGELDLIADEVTPEQFVDPAAFNAEKYPLAVYTGPERYCYTVSSPGDGAAALLRYVREGGTLLVAGLCWPFYRPVDWINGEWVDSSGQLPKFTGDVDAHLLSQMRELNQTSLGNFNRYLGLNISGEGTKQFEAPEESITMRKVPDAPAVFGLPDEFAFPTGADSRFRPASPRHGMDNVEFQAVVIASGESGTEYGPGMAVLRHRNAGGRDGLVIYVWGSLMQTIYAPGITKGVMRVASMNSTTEQERATAKQLVSDAGVLRQRVTPIGARLKDSPKDVPARTYLIRQSDHLLSMLDTVEQMVYVKNFRAAGGALATVEGSAQRLARRADALVPGGGE